MACGFGDHREAGVEAPDAGGTAHPRPRLTPSRGLILACGWSFSLTCALAAGTRWCHPASLQLPKPWLLFRPRGPEGKDSIDHDDGAWGPLWAGRSRTTWLCATAPPSHTCQHAAGSEQGNCYKGPNDTATRAGGVRVLDREGSLSCFRRFRGDVPYRADCAGLAHLKLTF